MSGSYPIKVLFDVKRNTVEPFTFGGEHVFHYSLPVWHETKDGQVEEALGLASLKLLLEGGEILVSKLNPKKGVVIQAKSKNLPVLASTEFIALKPRFIDPRFAFWLMQSSGVRYQLEGSIESVTNSHKRARIDRFLASRVTIPDLDTQKAIAAFLDRETARIDRLIEKKERISDLIRSKWEGLIHKARQEPNAHWARLNTIVERIARPIGATEDTSFVPLGLYNQGRGFFKKMETEEDDLGDSTFFWVCKDDIVFSGQFAWEGAIGLVNWDEDGCVVSHRYPVYRAKEGVEGAYIYAFFRTAHGAFLMDNCSRGSAGRNRPLHTGSLERERILIPSESVQQQIATLVRQEAHARDLVRAYTDRAKELRAALITAAVTGQIDVREQPPAIAAKPDRRLDAVQDVM